MAMPTRPHQLALDREASSVRNLYSRTTRDQMAPMIDRTQLTEALVWADEYEKARNHEWVTPIAEAARLLLDFPTDEQTNAFVDEWNATNDIDKAVLAVRDTMIGDTCVTCRGTGWVPDEPGAWDVPDMSMSGCPDCTVNPPGGTGRVTMIGNTE